MQRIVAVQPDVHLLLMGFPGVQHYHQRAVDLGVAHAVTLTGRIPYQDAPKYVALGDVAAAPKLSLTEGSGKLLNYMAAALPTVAFDTPVAREYLGNDGMLAVRGDVDSLAAKLLDCLFPTAGAATQIAAVGRQLRRRVLQQFSWQQAGQIIVATYAELLAQRQQKGPQKRQRQGQHNSAILPAPVYPTATELEIHHDSMS